jgi:hypothetical protein
MIREKDLRRIGHLFPLKAPKEFWEGRGKLRNPQEKGFFLRRSQTHQGVSNGIHRRNEKNERLKPLGNFATMRVCKGLSKMSFKKAVKVAQSVKV